MDLRKLLISDTILYRSLSPLLNYDKRFWNWKQCWPPDFFTLFWTPIFYPFYLNSYKSFVDPLKKVDLVVTTLTPFWVLTQYFLNSLNWNPFELLTFFSPLFLKFQQKWQTKVTIFLVKFIFDPLIKVFWLRFEPLKKFFDSLLPQKIVSFSSILFLIPLF